MYYLSTGVPWNEHKMSKESSLSFKKGISWKDNANGICNSRDNAKSVKIAGKE